MEIPACPRCGSLEMRMPTVQDGMWPGGGETNFQVCAVCGYRGMPILFADVAALEAFRGTERTSDEDMASTPKRQVAMPAFIGLVGCASIGGTAVLAAGLVVSGTAWHQWLAAAGLLGLGLAVGVSFLVIAWRSWNLGRKVSP
jgi:hypothetical protein